ncbi:Quinolinate synthase A [Caldalkalibacillus thermarum TA2.A1]|uniref:Quinolinate synthase n=1 Tax=Caldalkalibacillus thermarum (strain TA2.A1) TaxID=986075 RepID=F5L590_CALTT|nr:quinolinate synthase NadA [Caldalkalibacillus thermarum]EGL83488.1 Quinolinate synthase A [Caldalkalibacillus thermarum TA2.A1]QZT34385.1 quinolinate synthase NadA [Caldalkalibacillus thermarum TA2.A1]
MTRTPVKPSSISPEFYEKWTREEMEERVRAIKQALGDKLVILGHHYQKDEVFQFADFTGDSLKLAQLAAQQQQASFIVFCGVHFMAETADILTADHQTVILPDLKAGCSMADMADDEQVEECWDILTDLFGQTIVPMTYVNSTAAIKAFCGLHGGITCTSSNAKKMFQWAFEQKERILFLPDEHLGRNTAASLGLELEEMAVYNPLTRELEHVQTELENIKVILWKGFCSVHQHFKLEHVEKVRKRDPEMRVLVHPECCYEVVSAADDSGSTEYIIKQVKQAPSGAKWAIGTEVNLVQRLAQNHPEQTIRLLNDMICPCLTMNRIDLPHLLWALESIHSGEIVNAIRVPEEVAGPAKLALDRMLALS